MAVKKEFLLPSSVSDFHFPSSDGIHSCYARLWLPSGLPRAVVQIVHGVADHITRYESFARFLTDHGFAVCGEDHLGHGQTAAQDNRFGYFAEYDGWTLVTQDVRSLRERMGQRFPGVPYILLGHSMGSFLTRTYLCRYPGTVDAAILSGTGQEPALTVAFGKAVCSFLCRVKGGEHCSQFVYRLSLGAYNKSFRPNRTTADWVCSDEALVDAYLRDPFCTFTPTVGLMRDMMSGLQYISSRRALSQMDRRTPVYLFSGDRDPVGQNGAGVRKVYGYFKDHGCKDVAMKLYPGGRHEMLNESNHTEVWADVLNWMNARLLRSQEERL